MSLDQRENKKIALLLCIAGGASVLLNLWAAGAVGFDAPWPQLHGAPGLVLYATALLLFVVTLKNHRVLGSLTPALAVLTWWNTLEPVNSRQWQPDVSQTPYAHVSGDCITFHNVRNCQYRTANDYTPVWETRSFKLSEVTGVDLAINYWGSPYMAHPIVSFQFSEGPSLAISIETRKELGESYSAVGGLYRQFELIYIVGDERDLIGVRTNFRPGEDVYLMRTTLSPERARKFLLQYVEAMNELRQKPRWYNAVTTNCTTTIRTQRPLTERSQWDWRILVNGLADRMLYEHGMLQTDGLSFPEYKKRVHINAKAKELEGAPDFSAKLRNGLPGFGSSQGL